MYNGIGLSSVRGSATSGYVQTNAFNRVRKTQNDPRKNSLPTSAVSTSSTGPNADVLEHNRKRELELKVFEYRVELEDEGLEEEEIERRVEVFRAELMMDHEEKRVRERGGEEGAAPRGGGTHEAAARKEHDMERLRAAFGVGGYEEGAAFTREYHEMKKIERERVREEKARVERERGEAREEGEAAVLRRRLQELDDEMDRMKEEREQALEDDSGVPRKRARHDTESEDEQEREEGGAESPAPEEEDEEGEQEEDEEGEQEEDEEAEKEVAPDEREVERGVAQTEMKTEMKTTTSDPAEENNGSDRETSLEEVVMGLFSEHEVLRKKEIVAAAETAGVAFNEKEYSKLMRSVATSQPGGKWKRNA